MALTEVSITGTTTVTSSGYGKMHVCSGTSADYAVTMPSAVTAGAGILLGFRMAASSDSPALTKLVTLTNPGGGGGALDGVGTRVMWKGESCILESNGAEWKRIAGKTIPMLCFMRLSANQGSVASATNTTILLDTTDTDNTGVMADTANSRVIILRNSNYNIRGNVQIDGASMSADAVRMIGGLDKDPNTGTYANILQHEVFAKIGSYTSGAPAAFGYGLAVGDKLRIGMYQNSGSTASAYGAAFGASCTLSVCEVPVW